MKKALLLLACTVALTGCEFILGEEPQRSGGAVFDEVWREFDRHYSFFEVKDIDWNASRARYRPAATAALTNSQLAEAIWDMLEPLHDVHVNLVIPFRTFSDTSHLAHPDHFHADIVFEEYVTNDRSTTSRHFRYGTIGTDIGYIWIPTFGSSGWADEIDSVLENIDGVDALIIDVRSNGGGASSNSDQVAGRFFDTRRIYSHVRFRNGPRHHDFTPLIEQSVGPRGRQRFSGRIAVLTNRHTFSAAESFVLAMKTLPNVVVVGDTTGGGSGNPLQRELPNGWRYQVPQWIQYDLDGGVIEDRGIAPHVYVPGAAGDRSRGVDAALSRALELLRQS